MRIRKLIEKRIRRAGGGIDVATDVNAVISANVAENTGVSSVSSSQRSAEGSEGTVAAGDTGEGEDARRRM